MKRALILTTLTLAALGLSGCNTVEGVGKDIKSAGKAIEKSAQ
ncbi:entericidin [Niveispirillum lacus]|uniref:Entericidin n=1 Tax=Niveispirillum lacus TaxID=1981099 RepID=A0A255YX25_9PROT|nr:entericidin A/B family lipoprotein [Niveispirillum lacus]OYQ33797.1 entericidin [Niveispirillum lacus]